MLMVVLLAEGEASMLIELLSTQFSMKTTSSHSGELTGIMFSSLSPCFLIDFKMLNDIFQCVHLNA